MFDLISRQAAIDALGERPYLWTGGDYELGCVNQYDSDKLAIETVQPAQQWIPFTKRELTAEEQEEHPEWCYIMECPLPEENQEILVSNGKWVWLDTFCVDDGCYLDSDHELEGCAWMPLPKPWEGGDS